MISKSQAFPKIKANLIINLSYYITFQTNWEQESENEIILIQR